MYRSFLLVLALLPNFTTNLFSQSSQDDFFPLAVGNRWTYSVSSYFNENMEEYETSDTGNATCSIISKLTSSDSIIWTFQQTRQLSHRYKNWFHVDTTYPLSDTLSFHMIEYLSPNHQLASSPQYSCLLSFAFQSNYPDSSTAYRYHPQQMRDSLTLSRIRYITQGVYDTLFVSLQRSRGPLTLFRSYAGMAYWGRDNLILNEAVLVGVKRYDRPDALSDLILQNNYPNPFNPVTTIPFYVSEKTRATVYIFDLIGRPIRMLFDKTVNRGHYVAYWNAGEYPSGTYLCVLRSNEHSRAMKITLLK